MLIHIGNPYDPQGKGHQAASEGRVRIAYVTMDIFEYQLARGGKAFTTDAPDDIAIIGLLLEHERQAERVVGVIVASMEFEPRPEGSRYEEVVFTFTDVYPGAL